MKRREFLEVAAGALLASSTAATQPSMHAQSASPAGSPAAGTLKVDIYSRHLQWLRSADEVADAAIEMGFDGVNLTVRPYPGHVDPDNVATELPPFVNTLRKRGLLVRSITTNISDADSPNAATILATAASLGVTHFWWGTYRYELRKPIFEQLDALKPRVARLAALSEKHEMTAAYHTYSMPGQVGSVMWDLLYLLSEFDPKFVGFHYDTGHEAHHINGMWEVNLRAAGRYIAALAVKDYAPEQNPGFNGAAGNAWRTRSVPLGTGLVDLPRIAAALTDLHFAGPIEIQAEYPNGGADSAQDYITLPREQVLGAMKRDLLTLRRGFAALAPS
jgi:L-ribulose-5-phosphate 3-epimerase